MRRFVALSYSPWSEKARWALDHHRVEYREIEFKPVLGVPWLRWVTRRPFGRVSVPTLLDDVPYLDSLLIAQRAEEIGQGSRLFSDANQDAIARYNELSETLIAAARELRVPRIALDPEAALEATPAALPGRRMFAVTSVKLAGFLIARKYKMGRDAEKSLATIRQGLTTLRQELQGRQTLLPAFSYADIAMAVTLQWIEPLAPSIRPVEAGLRRVLSLPEIAAEFSDLVAWRDDLYAQYRQPT